MTQPIRREVSLVDISPHHPYQTRKNLDVKLVNEYATAMKNGTSFPPVKLGVVGGALVVIGGHHRIAATYRRGLPTITADVYETDHPGAVLLAIDDNSTNGKRLSKAEVRAALSLFVKAGNHKVGRGKVMSSRQLAAALGGSVSHETVLHWIAEDHPAVYSKFKRDAPKPKGSGEFDYRAKNAERSAQAAFAAIEQCLAAARGVSSPKVRGRIRERLLKASVVVETLGPYELPQDDGQTPSSDDF